MIPVAVVLALGACVEWYLAADHQQAALTGLGLTARLELRRARTCQRAALVGTVVAGLLLVLDLLGGA